MSIFVPANYIPKELEEKIILNVYVIKKISPYLMNKFKGNIKADCVRPYLIDHINGKQGIHLPFHWALQSIPGARRTEVDVFHTLQQPYSFTKTLREIQKEVKAPVIEALNRNGCHLLSLYPGAGKTNLAIYLATKIKLKTLIICDSIVLLEQWKKAIQDSLQPSPTVAIVKQIPKGASEKIREKAKQSFQSDFLLVYVENISILGREVFKDVGFVIVDEIHKIVAENLSTCLFHLSPRFLLGLSATPTRPDGMDQLLDFYFGKENKTVRELYHPHLVYKKVLDYSYEDIPSSQWTEMISEQCLSPERNAEIVKILTEFLRTSPTRNVLVLSKRVEQVGCLEKMFQENGFLCSSLAGSNNVYDPNAQIILGITSKVGTGFSCDKLDTLVLASDIISQESSDYMVQYIARVMRNKEVEPIIFDFVDDHPVMKKHFGIRKKQYQKYGGKIVDI